MIPSHSVQPMYLRNSGVDYHAILHCIINENLYRSGWLQSSWFTLTLLLSLTLYVQPCLWIQPSKLSYAYQRKYFDLVITSAESNKHDLSVSEVHPLLPTDHLTNIQHALQSRQWSKSHMFFDYCKANFEGLCNHLLDLSDCFILDSVENVQTKIRHAILSAMHIYFPKVKLKPHKQRRWYNSDIQHHLNCINRKSSLSHKI